MDHHEAQQSQAVARYILNEMSDDERDRFEEHYFDCRDCGADVLAGERLRANVRVPKPVSQPESVKNVVVPFPPRPPWKNWVQTVAAAMLAVVVTYLVIPRIQGPVPRPPGISIELLDPAPLLDVGENRGAGGTPEELRAGVPSAVVVGVGEMPFAGYEIQLRDAAGKVVATSSPVNANRVVNGRVELLLRSLPAGSYVLAVHGVRTDGNRAVIATHPIRVREGPIEVQ